MKELSIEEKAKAYDEAFETARKINSGEGVAAPSGWTVCEVIFPELTESEDDKIRKKIIALFKGQIPSTSEEDNKKFVAWLEKQGEQKPDEEYNITGISSNKSQGKLGEIIKNLKTTWSEKDEVGLANAMWAIEQARTIAKDENAMGNLWYAERWLKSLKDRVQPQKQEWSEEDEITRNALINLVEMYYGGCIDKSEKNRLLNFLNSLRPQNTWKPSDEQMEILKELVEDSNQRYFYTILKSLYEQLKNLRDG